LQGEQLGVEAAAAEQLSVIAGLGDPAVVHDDDLVGHVNAGEAVRDEHGDRPVGLVLYAVLFSARRSATLGRPAGSSPLSRLALQIVLRGMRPAERSLPPGEPAPVG
jgi:hypothetical protein